MVKNSLGVSGLGCEKPSLVGAWWAISLVKEVSRQKCEVF